MTLRRAGLMDATASRLAQAVAAGTLVLGLLLTGCGHHGMLAEKYVYVTAKQAYLHDRVAAVSNRTGEVQNGDRLLVLDHQRKFVKVRTEKGVEGWIKEMEVATPDVSQQFLDLQAEHKGDTPVASGVVRDQVYLHLKPGRESEHFYLLNEGDKLQLLRRSTVERILTQGQLQRVQKLIPQAPGSHAEKKEVTRAGATAPAEPPAPPTMEDWWLVRDAQGRTGWMLSRMLDVDAPDAVAKYAEGQRIVGTYQLAVVHDEGAPTDNKDIPEYVMVLSPYKAGLPYDFDQVRLFVWSLSKHRYETGFRERNVEGYLPVKTSAGPDPWGKAANSRESLPIFEYKLLPEGVPPPSPDSSGAMKPARLVTRTWRLEGNTVHRLAPPGSVLDPVARPEPEPEKKGKHHR